MRCSLGISNFPEEISSLSHSVVFLYFFALLTEEGFLIFLAILWNSAFKWVYLSFSLLLLASLLFSAICKDSLDNHVAFLHFFFLEMVLILPSTVSQTSVHSSSRTPLGQAISPCPPQWHCSLLVTPGTPYFPIYLLLKFPCPRYEQL